MTIRSRLFPPKSLTCPHCERELTGHDVDACARKRMSRRFFFGVIGGAVAAVAMPKVTTGGLFNPHANVAAKWKAASGMGRNRLVPWEEMVKDIVVMLRSNLSTFEPSLGAPVSLIGTTVRKPYHPLWATS